MIKFFKMIENYCGWRSDGILEVFCVAKFVCLDKKKYSITNVTMLIKCQIEFTLRWIFEQIFGKNMPAILKQCHI